MSDLIKRLQEVEAGSRELDAEICVALRYGGENSSGAENVRTDPDWEGDLLFEIGTEACCNPLPRLTTSLDAIVALIGEKLPGRDWSIAQDENRCSGFAGQPCGHWANTPALALCAALLSALQQEGG